MMPNSNTQPMQQYPVKNILVIGHRNPDTDSICSAISYAFLKNKLNQNPALVYEPRRAGDVNNETRFVLNYFGVPWPALCDNVSPQVEDLDIPQIQGVKGSTSMRGAWNQMRDTEITTLAIVDNESRLQGLITMSDVAKAYMDMFNTRTMASAKTTYASVAQTLSGQIIVGDADETIPNGKICVAAGNAAAMANIIEEHDIVILSNRADSQMMAIELGAGCMIVTANSVVPQHIQQMARNHGIAIINTPHDSYTTARLVSQSAPVSYFMTQGALRSFDMKTRIEEVQKEMIHHRYRYFPIIDGNGRYYGMLSRRDVMDMQKKQIIMVDHNELGQAVEGMDQAEVLEIIDHHRLGSSVQTSAPLYFRNQPVGCTCTIVYQMYSESRTEIPRQIAGLMCSAILSDTLAFRSPTCTPLDRSAAENLALIAGIDIDKYAAEMFEAGASLDGMSAEDIFYTDFKPFASDNFNFGIGQSCFMSERTANKAKEILMPYLETVLEREKLDMVCYMLTNIFTQSTELIYAGSHAPLIVASAFPTGSTGESSAQLPGVVSRKKQMVPNLTNGIMQWRSEQ